ncbi:MAG: general secretion pathway protein GspB [Verrucomicrobiae bacterium]|nr:general secretion pathway protein GspB [Verrucomicrobiae bacterium]
MKLLQNPVVVVVLVVAAVWVVVSASRPKTRPGRGSKPATSAKVESVQPQTTNQTVSVQIRPEKPIDIAYVEKRAREWMEAPARDPFFAYALVRRTPPQGTNAPVRLVLSAIWRQSGGTFAVINGVVCGEGDRVEGFRVERIEDDRVIVENGEWREVVRFSTGLEEDSGERREPELRGSGVSEPAVPHMDGYGESGQPA